MRSRGARSTRIARRPFGPELARQRVAAIGMKSLGGDGRVIKKRAARVDDALRYAMSLGVCTTVSGIDSMGGVGDAGRRPPEGTNR